MIKKKRKPDKIKRSLIAYTTPRSFVTEQYRTLRTNINFSSIDHDIRSIVVTSAAPAEGKSTTAANLAIVYAQEGKTVLLIDGDMRRPTMHHTFRVKNVHGLSSVLTSRAAIQDVVRATPIKGLNLLTCGPIPPNPAELFASKSMGKLIEHLKELYDLVIFDSPPLLSVTDGQILMNKCEGVVLVLKSGTTEKQEAMKAKEVIKLSNSKLLGVVLNNYSLSKKRMYKDYIEAE